MVNRKEETKQLLKNQTCDTCIKYRRHVNKLTCDKWDATGGKRLIVYQTQPLKHFFTIPFVRVYFRYNQYLDESDDLYKGVTIDFGIFNTMHIFFIPIRKR